MKKSNLLTTAAAVMLLTAAPAAAQTCIKTPSCADLGYTKTAADCAGKTVLKFPLDNTQVYCPGYEETLRTYKVGDIYYDERGIGIGTIVYLDSSQKHGIVIAGSSLASSDTATLSCSERTAGDLNWEIAKGDYFCQIYGHGSGSTDCQFLSSTGYGHCWAGGNTWSSDNCTNDSTKLYGFACQAQF